MTRPRPPEITNVELQSFRAELGPRILDWARSDEELDAWASLRGRDAGVFAIWHDDPDVLPFVMAAAGEPLAYGEIWREADESELARVIVADHQRSRGIGRTLMRMLAREAFLRGARVVWVRVASTNVAALLCYRAAGFVRVSQAEERAFNAAQPRPYVWLRYDERAFTSGSG